MRQTRLSIGCRDWQGIIEIIGPEAAGALVYLRTLMRSLETAELAIRIPELAGALRITEGRAAEILDAIVSGGYLTRTADPFGVITLRSPEEAAAIAERDRKRRASAARKFRYTLFNHTDRSQTCTRAVGSAPLANDNKIQKEHTTEVMMVYDPKTGGSSEYTLFNQTGNSGQAEKEPHTPQKEESLTEIQTHTRSNKTCEQPELPADSLEAEFIDVVGSWPISLRETLKTEPEETREAFYLYIRTRKEQEGNWSADRVRIAWLAARRIPAERRADSILAAAMGNWKTIRDCGSGVYFEKSTGRIVSLVRGPVEPQQTGTRKTNAELAVQLAKNMRRD